MRSSYYRGVDARVIYMQDKSPYFMFPTSSEGFEFDDSGSVNVVLTVPKCSATSILSSYDLYANIIFVRLRQC